MTRIVAIIPARMGSSRFPGKPLLQVRGLPMVEHVRRRALLCRAFAEVVVATCDAAIAEVVTGFGGRCLMTSPAHPAATDRVAEAARQLDCTHVINVQGDELLVLPSDLARMAQAMQEEPEVPAWNAVARLLETPELADPSVVKCALSQGGRILFCTRRCDQHGAAALAAESPWRRVLGILGYRKDFLLRYGDLARTPMEQAESIDQMRIVEHDTALRAIEFSRGYPGINEPREVELVHEVLTADATQQHVLAEIL